MANKKTLLICFSISPSPNLEERYNAVCKEIERRYSIRRNLTKNNWVIETSDSVSDVRDYLGRRIYEGRNDPSVIFVVDISLQGWALHSDESSGLDSWLRGRI